MLCSTRYRRYTHSGQLYTLVCHTCVKSYTGKTGRLKIGFDEHQTYISTNKSKSAYALHILNKGHEYRPLHKTK